MCLYKVVKLRLCLASGIAFLSTLESLSNPHAFHPLCHPEETVLNALILPQARESVDKVENISFQIIISTA